MDYQCTSEVGIFLKRLGDSCRGLIAAVLQNSEIFNGLKTNGRKVSGSVQVATDHRNLYIQLWWEVLPWVRQVISDSRSREP